MNIEDRIKRAVEHGKAQEMDEILNSKLDDGADHVQMLLYIQRQQSLLRFFGTALVNQGQALIELRQKIVELEADMAAAGIGSANDAKALVGFDAPKLEV